MITLKRHWFTVKSTIGVLTFPDGASFFILEDVARAAGVKIPKETAIPDGDYRIRITFSNRFQILTPIIYIQDDLSIDDGRGNKWTGVRIHPGNLPADTEGCPLPGRVRQTDRVAESRVAFEDITARITAMLASGLNEVPLRIVNEQIP